MVKHGIILGVGNEHRGDDGVGLAVVRELIRHHTYSGWDLELAGDDLFQVMSMLHGRSRAIIIDAIAMPMRKSGEFHSWRVDQGPLPWQSCSLSTHGMCLGDILELARSLHRLPEVCLVVGITIEESPHRVGLSPEVSEAMVQLLHDMPAMLRMVEGAGSQS